MSGRQHSLQRIFLELTNILQKYFKREIKGISIWCGMKSRGRSCQHFNAAHTVLQGITKGTKLMRDDPIINES